MLKYPEGVACADVLIAGERGGDLAKMVFKGVGAAMLYKFLYGIIGLWNETRDLVPDGPQRDDPRRDALLRRHARVPGPRATSSGRGSPASSPRAASSPGSRSFR